MLLQVGILPLQLALLTEQSLKPLLKLALKDRRQFLQKLAQAAGLSEGGAQLPLEMPQGGRGGRRGL